MDSADSFAAWLISQGLPPDRLRAALAGRASQDSRALSMILLEQGVLSQQQAAQALAAYHASGSRELDPRSLPAGTYIGPYIIERALGVGGMGAVFLVKSPEGESLALKILLQRDPQTLARFERERRLLGRLSADEGFVPLRDAGESPYGPFIVTELMPGGSLRDRLKKREKLDGDEVEHLARTLAGALALAHEKGIIHRDLKPDNILFDERGEALISDLGIGKSVGPQSQEFQALTGTQSSIGTPAYMAPEQLDSSRELGPSADIWSLGVLLYEALVGERPFQGNNPTEELLNISRGRCPALSSLDVAASPTLISVIESCLELEPEARPRDGRALLEALDASPAEPPSSSSALAWSLALVALMLIGSLALVLLLTQAPPAAPDQPKIQDGPKTPTGPTTQPEEPSTPTATLAQAWKMPRLRSALKRAQEQNSSRLLQPTWLWGTGDHSEIGALTSIRRLAEQGLLVTAGFAGTIRLWSEDRGSELLSVSTDLPGGCYDLLIHEQEGVIIASSHSIDEPGKIGFWEIETGAPQLQAIEAPRRARLAWLERPGQARELVAAGFDGVAIWSWPKLELRARWRDEPDASGEQPIENYISLSVRPEQIVLSRHDGSLSLLNPESGELIVEQQHQPGGFERMLDGGPLGIFALSRRRLLTRIDASSLRTQWETDGLDKNLAYDHIRAGALLPDGQLLTSGDDFQVRRWAIDRGERLASFPSLHNTWMTEMLALDSERALSVGNDGQIYFWRSADGAPLWPVNDPFPPGTCMACRPDNDGLIVALAVPGRSPNSSKLWIHEIWSARRTEFELPGYPTSLCPSPWGSGFLVSGCNRPDQYWIVEIDPKLRPSVSSVANLRGLSSPLKRDPSSSRVAYIVFGQGIFVIEGRAARPRLLRSAQSSSGALEVDLKWENGKLYTYGADFSLRDLDGGLVAPGILGLNSQERLLSVLPGATGEIGLVGRFTKERRIDRSRFFLRAEAAGAPRQIFEIPGWPGLCLVHEGLLLIRPGIGQTLIFDLASRTYEIPKGWLLADDLIAGVADDKTKELYVATGRGLIYRLERR